MFKHAVKAQLNMSVAWPTAVQLLVGFFVKGVQRWYLASRESLFAIHQIVSAVADLEGDRGVHLNPLWNQIISISWGNL